jgi:hypothetical protein
VLDIWGLGLALLPEALVVCIGTEGALLYVAGDLVQAPLRVAMRRRAKALANKLTPFIHPVLLGAELTAVAEVVFLRGALECTGAGVLALVNSALHFLTASDGLGKRGDLLLPPHGQMLRAQ